MYLAALDRISAMREEVEAFCQEMDLILKSQEPVRTNQGPTVSHRKPDSGTVLSFHNTKDVVNQYMSPLYDQMNTIIADAINKLLTEKDVPKTVSAIVLELINIPEYQKLIKELAELS